MKSSFAFVLLAMVLGLVCAAPMPTNDGENHNCFSLTYPVNGTVWNSYGTYEVLWDVTGTCHDTYYAYMISAVENENGEYALSNPQKAPEPVDLTLGKNYITLNLNEPAGTYVFTISKESGEDIDYTDLAVVTVV
ncbi:hypothetical protein F4703DRAFT_1849281 [Phycomyces blakesleeanus]